LVLERPLTSNSGVAPDETVSELKIQSLTDRAEKDYAIRLKGKSELELLAKTNPNTEYTNVISESNYLKDFRYNWKYTLNHWINHEKRK
jgi:hypothetical protein